MSTGRDLVTRSLLLTGVLSEGETASADQLTTGLSTANEMLDSWSTENLVIYSRVSETMTAPSGNAAPTMGPTTGTLSTTRPVEIETINAKDGTFEFPVDLIGPDQWAMIPDKTQTGTRPLVAYINYDSPLVTVNLWPIPSANVDLKIYSKKPLSTVDANTTISVPPGYMRAMRYNLCIELCAEYGVSATPEAVAIAKESKGNIKRQNKPRAILVADEMQASRRRFNIYTGE